MTCEMEFNQRGLQIPNEMLAALALSDITLEAHMCRHLMTGQLLCWPTLCRYSPMMNAITPAIGGGVRAFISVRI